MSDYTVSIPSEHATWTGTYTYQGHWGGTDDYYTNTNGTVLYYVSAFTTWYLASAIPGAYPPAFNPPVNSGYSSATLVGSYTPIAPNAETATVADAGGGGSSLTVSVDDTVTVTDAVSFTNNTTFADTVTVSDALHFSTSAVLSDSVVVSDALTLSVGAAFADKVVVSDGLTLSLTPGACLATADIVRSSIYSLYASAAPSPLLLIGTSLRGPCGIPQTVSSIAEAASIFGQVITESRVLKHGDTTCMLSEEPRSPYVMVERYDTTLRQRIPETLQSLSWSGATATFLPYSGVPDGESREVLFTYEPAADSRYLLDALYTISPFSSATCVRAGAVHSTAVLPMPLGTGTATVSGATVTFMSQSVPLQVGMICAAASYPTTFYRIVSLNGAIATLDRTVTHSPAPGATWNLGGALLLVTRDAGYFANGFTAAIRTVGVRSYLEIDGPDWLLKMPCAIPVSSGMTLQQLADAVTGRGQRGQIPFAALAYMPNMSVNTSVQTVPFSASTDGRDITDPAAWRDAMWDALQNADLANYAVVHLPEVAL